MNLTEAERLILWNQYAILQKIDAEQTDHYKHCQEILQCGYRSLYGELGQFEQQLPEVVFGEVADLLDMFRVLKYSYERLPDKSGIIAAELNFKGFDGNGGEGHYGLAKFMIEELGRWTEFSNSELNSHSQVLHWYRTMLDRYNESADKALLSKEDILRIILRD